MSAAERRWEEEELPPRFDWDRIEASLPETKAKILKFWPRLQASDLSGFTGNIDRLRTQVQRTYGYSAEKLDEEFARFKQILGVARPGFPAESGKI